jgi:DNA modification methylase
VKVNIDDLKPDQSNPNRMTKKQLAILKKSIEQHGFLKPIVINENLEILDGNKRYSVMKLLGKNKIDCVQKEGITSEVDKIIFRKQLNNHGEHDKVMDAEQFSLVFDNNASKQLAEALEMSQSSIMNTINRHGKGKNYNIKTDLQVGENNQKEDTKQTINPREIKYGDVINLGGNHTLFCIDCCDAEHLGDIQSMRFNYVLTDPPYNITDKINTKFLEGLRDYVIDLDNEQWDRSFNIDNFLFVLHNFYLLKSPDVIVDIFTSDVLLSRLKENFIENEYKTQYLVWCKTNPMPSVAKKHYQNATELIFHASKGNPNFNYPKKGNLKSYFEHPLNIHNRLHPTQKPQSILMNLVSTSTNKEDTVLDCFAGSGSVLMACEKTERNCVSIENQPKYCDVICKRFKADTGKDYNVVRNILK